MTFFSQKCEKKQNFSTFYAIWTTKSVTDNIMYGIKRREFLSSIHWYQLLINRDLRPFLHVSVDTQFVITATSIDDAVKLQGDTKMFLL